MQQFLTYDLIVKRCGDLEAWKIYAIEETGGTLGDFEAALAWAAAESDIMGEARIPLTGAAAAIYDILMIDDEDQEEEWPKRA